MKVPDTLISAGTSIPSVRPLGRYSLSVKLMAAFFAVSVVPLLLLFFLDSRRERATLAENANQSLRSAALQTAYGVDSFIENNLDAIGAEAQLPDLVEYLSLPTESRPVGEKEGEAASVLYTLARKDQANISSYALLDERGRILLDTYTPDIGTKASDDDYFSVPVATSGPFASPVEFSDAGKAFMYFSAPVRDTAAGRIVGVLYARFNAGVLEQIVVRNNGLAGRQSYAILVDENRLCLAHGTTSDLIFKSIVPLGPARVKELQAARRMQLLPAAELSTDLPEFDAALRGAEARPFFTASLDAGGGAMYSAAVTRLPSRPWSAVFVQPQAVFLASIRSQTRDALILVLVMSAFVAVIAAGIVRFLTTPIVSLTAAARRVANGDMSAKVRARTNDEIGILSDTFNAMTDELGQTLERLHSSIAEKEVLLKEIHHRVKNNLQMVISILSMQSSYLDEGAAQDAIESSRSRIYAIASIHDQLCQSESLTSIDFGEHLDLILDNLAQTYNSREIRVIRRMSHVLLELGNAVPCGLIANELVVNAYKHAFPAKRAGEIEIEVRRSGEGEATLRVRDDGIGFPENIDFRTMNSLGMQLVIALTEQLSGSIELDSSRGTEFTVRFPS